MSGYDVEPAELFAVQAGVGEAAAEGRAELARLRASAHDLLGYAWRGVAATAFDAGWQEWAAGAELVLHALQEMADALGRTAADYEQNEIAVRSGFARIAS